MIQNAIHHLVEGKNLDFKMTRKVMDEIMSGEATQAQISSFLTALRIKGETIDEITACAQVMRDKALCLRPPFPVMDIVGTGGDEAGTFNISTTSAFVAAAGGIRVAKHGNRSVSSKSGGGRCAGVSGGAAGSYPRAGRGSTGADRNVLSLCPGLSFLYEICSPCPQGDRHPQYF